MRFCGILTQGPSRGGRHQGHPTTQVRRGDPVEVRAKRASKGGGPPQGRRLDVGDAQSKRLETDSSLAVRPMASPIREAIDSTRMLRATRTASVGWIESVMTSSFSPDAVMRPTAPPDRTPWVI